MLRKLVVTLIALACAAPAAAGAAERTLLMPGVTYERQLQFTRHGPVVVHVVSGPRPGGLYELRPAVSNAAIVGLERLTAIERRAAASATVVGIAGDESPAGALIQGGVLQSLPVPERSSLGVDAAGGLSVAKVGYQATWSANGPRRPLVAINQPPGPNGVSLFTAAWGGVTPNGAGTVEAVLGKLPAVTPNVDVSGQVVALGPDGGRQIPSGGAILQARGSQAGRLAAEAPVASTITLRVLLSRPEWGAMVNALGGGPLLVRAGRPVFRPSEQFSSSELVLRQARSAVGQRADGSIVLVAVDGGQPGYSTGMTNFELAQALARQGAVTGGALGSGRAATMAFDGELLSRPSAGERPVADALLLSYLGVQVPAPEEDVVSPNDDGVADRQTLLYKVVAPSTVTLTLVGARPTPVYTETAARQPGVYRVGFGSEVFRAGGEGRWRWVVGAVDDSGRTSTAEREFWVNNTLQSLVVEPGAIVVRKRGTQSLRIGFTLTRAARVKVTIETVAGALVATLANGQSLDGKPSYVWNGRDRNKELAFGGRYLVRTSATNAFGTVELTREFRVRRG